MITTETIIIVNINNLEKIPGFEEFYGLQSNADLEESYRQSGQLGYITVTSDGGIVNGYRILAVARKAGAQTLKARVIEGTPTLYTRFQLNITRVKTDNDKVKEVKLIFDSTPNRQGLQNTEGEPYVRHEIISRLLNNRWKGDKTIKKLEYILNHDLPDNFLMKNILGKNWDVEPCYLFLTKNKNLDLDNNYGITERLEKGELSIVDANRLIESNQRLNTYSCTFVIPETCNSYCIDCVDLARMEEYQGTVDLLLTSIPFYKLKLYDLNDANQLGHDKTPEIFAERVGGIFNALFPTLKPSANVIINIGETYDGLRGLRIPDAVINAIERGGQLIYKDTLYWSKPNPKPLNDSVKRPWNCMEHLLWFVVDLDKPKFHYLTYPDKEKKMKEYGGIRNVDNNGNVSVSKHSMEGEYRRIFTHLEDQKMRNIIRTAAQKNRAVYEICEEGHPAIMSPYLPVVPILMLTDETDLVFDPFAGTNVVGKMSILLNRRALSAELSRGYYDIGCKMLESGYAAFDKNSLEHIRNEVYKNKSDARILLNSQRQSDFEISPK